MDKKSHGLVKVKSPWCYRQVEEMRKMLNKFKARLTSSWDFASKSPPKDRICSKILHILKLWLYIYISYTYIYIYHIYIYIIHQKHHTKIVVKLFSLNRFDHFGGDYFIDAYIYICIYIYNRNKHTWLQQETPKKWVFRSSAPDHQQLMASFTPQIWDTLLMIHAVNGHFEIFEQQHITAMRWLNARQRELHNYYMLYYNVFT